MDDATKPEWLKIYETTPLEGRNSGAWSKGMASPNPAGRPKGAAASKRERIAKALNDDGPEVVRKVIDAALEGDMTAAGLVLSRLTPPLRAQAEKVQFELRDDVPLSEQARQILQAVADGHVDADTAKLLITCIQSVAGIRAVEDLESRLAILEAKEVSA